MSLLRTPAGHDPTNPSHFANPAPWAAVEANSAASTGGALNGNPNATIAALRALDVKVLGVTQLGCSAFSFASLDMGTATYWAERWELARW